MLANDNDSSNPFHTDAQIYFLIDNWGIDLTRYLNFPRQTQTISFAVGDGGPSGTKNLNTDMLTILNVTMAPSSGSNFLRLRPRTLAEMDEKFPSWRDSNLGNAKPAYYIVIDDITASTNNFPQRTITTDRSLDEAMTMRIHGLKAPAPLGSTGTNSPNFPAEFHETGTYYAAWKMLIPRNPQKAAYFQQLYLSERRRLKSQMNEYKDSNTEVWDQYPVW